MFTPGKLARLLSLSLFRLCSRATTGPYLPILNFFLYFISRSPRYPPGPLFCSPPFSNSSKATTTLLYIPKKEKRKRHVQPRLLQPGRLPPAAPARKLQSQANWTESSLRKPPRERSFNPQYTIITIHSVVQLAQSTSFFSVVFFPWFFFPRGYVSSAQAVPKHTCKTHTLRA